MGQGRRGGDAAAAACGGEGAAAADEHKRETLLGRLVAQGVPVTRQESAHERAEDRSAGG